MEEKKTKLQQTVEMLAAQIAYAVEDAMTKKTAKVSHFSESGLSVDNLCLFVTDDKLFITLPINSDIIKDAISKPLEQTLANRKERLEAELKEVNNQLKEIQQ